MCIGCSIAMTDYQRITPTTHQAFLSVTCAAVPPFVPSVGCLGEPPNCSPSQGNCSPARWGDPLGDHLECQVGWHLKTGKKYSPVVEKIHKMWDEVGCFMLGLYGIIMVYHLIKKGNMRILLNYRSKVDVARSWFWAYSDRPIYRRIWNHTYLIFERVYHAKPFLPVSVRPLLGWS